MKAPHSADRANYAIVAALPGVEVLSARFASHRFGPHAHDTWAIGAVVRGAQDNSARQGVRRIVGAGELTAIAPGEAHAGRAAGDAACEYVMAYVPDEELRRHAMHVGVKLLAPGMAPLADARLAERLAAFVRLASQADAPSLRVQGEWCLLMEHILLRYANVPPRETPAAPGSGPMRRARA